VCLGGCPVPCILGFFGIGKQLLPADKIIDIVDGIASCGVQSFRYVAGLDLPGIVETHGYNHLAQGMKRMALEAGNAFGFRRYDQATLSGHVLGRNAGGAAVRVSLHRLNASEREHDSAASIAPGCAETEIHREPGTRVDFPRSRDFYFVLESGSHKRIAH